MRLGLVGLGKMGLAIAARLAEQGVEVAGWDADSSRLAELTQLGHAAAGSAAEVAESAECVISIISDDLGVRGLFTGDDGFLSVPVAGKLFVEMSTVSPATGRMLAPLVAARGASFLEAPVMGSIPRAREGTLLALAGGDADTVERARPWLEPLARRIAHVGPTGSGYTAKLCANVFMSSYLQSIAEATSLAAGAGIAVEDILDILAESPVASPWLANKGPILRGETGDMSLDLRSLRKDMMAAVGAGAELGVPMPAASAVLAALSATVATGAGALDLAEHAAVFRASMAQRPLTPHKPQNEPGGRG